VERILGFGRRERIGKNIYDFVHPRDTAGVRAAFQAGLENPGIVQTLLVRVSRNDGSWVHLEATGRMMVDIAGTHVAVVNSRAVTADRTAVREPVVSPALSERQVAVLRLVGQGMTNKQIAGELNVSPHTVKDNLKDAMRKLGQRNRAATVLAATQQGLL
jgi:PAS domain S-box-containing protein